MFVGVCLAYVSSPLSQAPALKTCVISALYLGNNAIGDEGVACMADGLSHARGLQELHLNNNEARSRCNAFQCSLMYSRNNYFPTRLGESTSVTRNFSKKEKEHDGLQRVAL